MFANRLAIETLVSSDTKATREEKDAVLSSLCGKPTAASDDAKVYSIEEAARFLGKPRKSVYHLLRTGTLKGFYSGRKHTRATGITRESLEAAVATCKGGRR